MKISVVVASRPNVPPQEEIEVATVADRLGFRELWIGEGWVWDAFVLATAIATRTDQIGITVGPILVSVRDPVMMWSLVGYLEVAGYATMFQTAGFGAAVELASGG